MNKIIRYAFKQVHKNVIALLLDGLGSLAVGSDSARVKRRAPFTKRNDDGSVYCKHLSSIHITTQAHQQSTFRALSSSCLILHTKEHKEQHFIPVPAIATDHPSTQQTVGKASSAQPFDPNDQQRYFLTDQYTDAQRLQRFEENTGKRTTTCCILICVLFSIVLFAGGTLLVVSKVLRDQCSNDCDGSTEGSTYCEACCNSTVQDSTLYVGAVFTALGGLGIALQLIRCMRCTQKFN